MRVCHLSILVLCVFLLLATACTRGEEAPSMPAQPHSDAMATDPTSVPVTHATQEATEPPATVANAAGLQQLAMSKADVLRRYREAVDLVKLRCPGFTRTLRNEIYEVGTDGGVSAKLVGALLQVLFEDDRSGDSVMTIEKGDDLACRTYFPVYDTEYGCRLEDENEVEAAVCYDHGDRLELYIRLRDVVSPRPETDGIFQIMTPFSVQTLVQNLNAYIPYINEQNLHCTLRYFNCEIQCVLDRQTGRVIALSQKMVTALDADVAVDWFVTESAIGGTGTMINHLDYTDFLW